MEMRCWLKSLKYTVQLAGGLRYFLTLLSVYLHRSVIISVLGFSPLQLTCKEYLSFNLGKKQYCPK